MSRPWRPATTCKPARRNTRLGCIAVLLKTWPGLDGKKLTSIEENACNEWATRFRNLGYSPHYFNQTLSTLRHILNGGELSPNPARKVKRLGVKLWELHLPEPDQFHQLLDNLEHGGGRSSRNGADLVRFLAFSGCHLSEGKGVTWNDVDLKKGTLKVKNAKQRTTSAADSYRTVPIISDLRALHILHQWCLTVFAVGLVRAHAHAKSGGNQLVAPATGDPREHFVFAPRQSLRTSILFREDVFIQRQARTRSGAETVFATLHRLAGTDDLLVRGSLEQIFWPRPRHGTRG
ncbi:MAG: hypothetical protein JF609_05570 [Verrucomicrobia bacterium]|nr:hypothetical protein [Verrucomicrobiota bacterium]